MYRLVPAALTAVVLALGLSSPAAAWREPAIVCKVETVQPVAAYSKAEPVDGAVVRIIDSHEAVQVTVSGRPSETMPIKSRREGWRLLAEVPAPGGGATSLILSTEGDAVKMIYLLTGPKGGLLYHGRCVEL